MSRKDITENNANKLYINIITVVVFASVMIWFVVYFMRSEPNVHASVMEEFARKFQQSASNAHWQWQAKGRPERIMLLHFNEQGQEIDRRPVRMAHFGMPWAQPSSKGCAKLWQTLLNVPLQVEGFRVIAEYFAPDSDADEQVLGFCRYRLSRGPHFDYTLLSGSVEFMVNS